MTILGQCNVNGVQKVVTEYEVQTVSVDQTGSNTESDQAGDRDEMAAAFLAKLD